MQGRREMLEGRRKQDRVISTSFAQEMKRIGSSSTKRNSIQNDVGIPDSRTKVFLKAHQASEVEATISRFLFNSDRWSSGSYGRFVDSL